MTECWWAHRDAGRLPNPSCCSCPPMILHTPSCSACCIHSLLVFFPCHYHAAMSLKPDLFISLQADTNLMAYVQLQCCDPLKERECRQARVANIPGIITNNMFRLFQLHHLVFNAYLKKRQFWSHNQHINHFSFEMNSRNGGCVTELKQAVGDNPLPNGIGSKRTDGPSKMILPM